MALALPNTRGVAPATMNGQLIPELGVAPDTQLSDIHDIHFGLNIKNTVNPGLYFGLDDQNALDADLLLWEGLGPRTIEIKRRGGRTAEYDFVLAGGIVLQHYAGTGLDRSEVRNFNRRIPVRPGKKNFPATARMNGGTNIGGNPRYQGNATHKHQSADPSQGGTRWSKTALEYALSRGQGRIHYHLTGMGELSGVLDKSGDYGYNVTGRELRYIRRWWMRFQDKVIFYNGYTAAEKAVIVMPPWTSTWEPDGASKNCRLCDKEFGRFRPIRYRHHCRLCGKLVCDSCSPHRVRLKYPVKRPTKAMETGAVRVCTKCYRPNSPSTYNL